jgi:hypothetical protein
MGRRADLGSGGSSVAYYTASAQSTSDSLTSQAMSPSSTSSACLSSTSCQWLCSRSVVTHSLQHQLRAPTKFAFTSSCCEQAGCALSGCAICTKKVRGRCKQQGRTWVEVAEDGGGRLGDRTVWGDGKWELRVVEQADGVGACQVYPCECGSRPPRSRGRSRREGAKRRQRGNDITEIN